MATASDADGDSVTDADVWNGICEDADCTDTNYHATTEQLMERIHNANANVRLLDRVSDIIEDEYKRWRDRR